MIYISKLPLSVRSVQALKEMDDPYQMHRTLAKAFGAQQREARCLFRVEDRTTNTPYVLVQSRLEPDWASLTVPAGYLAGAPQVKCFEPYLSKGTLLAFRLLARPTKREGTTGKRLGLKADEEKKAWLAGKGAKAGIRVLSCRLTEWSWVDSKGGDKSKPLGATLFEGVLAVDDSDAFRDSVETGIGTGKSVGFGLLSLAPA
jgi:CRISPR system Cascade subunit CasE